MSAALAVPSFKPRSLLPHASCLCLSKCPNLRVLMVLSQCARRITSVCSRFTPLCNRGALINLLPNLSWHPYNSQQQESSLHTTYSSCSSGSSSVFWTPAAEGGAAIAAGQPIPGAPSPPSSSSQHYNSRTLSNTSRSTHRRGSSSTSRSGSGSPGHVLVSSCSPCCTRAHQPCCSHPAHHKDHSSSSSSSRQSSYSTSCTGTAAAYRHEHKAWLQNICSSSSSSNNGQVFADHLNTCNHIPGVTSLSHSVSGKAWLRSSTSAYPKRTYFTTSSSNARGRSSPMPNSEDSTSSNSRSTQSIDNSSTTRSSTAGVSRKGFGGKVSVPVISVLQEPLIADAAEVSFRAHHIGKDVHYRCAI